MYQDKFVVAIKSGGKVLREAKDLVHLPFGSEFSVLVKNLNSRRAKFTLHIDGQDVLDGQEIIVNANSEVEMKRFIRNGNLDEGNAFKFIERTAAIENGPRGIKVDDGIVRVEFWFEKEEPKITTTYHRDIWWEEQYKTTKYWDGYFKGPIYSTGSSIPDVTLSSSSPLRGMNVSQNASYSATTAIPTPSSPVIDADMAVPDSADVTVTNDVGITVPGSKVEQKFHTVYGFKSETQSSVMIIRLVGRTGAINVVAPVTVKTKQKCITCGHLNKVTAKFCSDCGTSLEIL